MFSIYENNKKISGACHSFVLCLDYVAISPFICFNTMRLRNTEADLRVPLFKTANGQKSVSFRGPKIWNQLSSDFRLPPSLFTFKRRLKEVIEG